MRYHSEALASRPEYRKERGYRLRSHDRPLGCIEVIRSQSSFGLFFAHQGTVRVLAWTKNRHQRSSTTLSFHNVLNSKTLEFESSESEAQDKRNSETRTQHTSTRPHSALVHMKQDGHENMTVERSIYEPRTQRLQCRSPLS